MNKPFYKSSSFWLTILGVTVDTALATVGVVTPQMAAILGTVKLIIYEIRRGLGDPQE